MMTIIKQGIITLMVFFAVFFFMPTYCYAEYDDEGYFIQIPIEYDSLRYNEWFSIVVNDEYIKQGTSGVSGVTPNKVNNIKSYENLDSLRAIRCALVCKPSGNGVYGLQYYIFNSNISGNLSYSYVGESGIYNKPYSFIRKSGTVNYSYKYETVSLSTNIPMFIESDGSFELSKTTLNPSGDAYNWLVNGILNGTSNVIGYGYEGDLPIDSKTLGFIKPSYYVNGNTVQALGAQQLETINWQNESTTGYDLTQSGVKIQFAMKDNSYLTGSSKWWGSGLNNLIDNIDKVVRDYVYPTGSSKDVTIRGIGRKSAINGQMMNLRIVDGTSKPQTFRVIDQIYNNRALNTDDTLYQHVNNYMSGGKSWYDSLIELVNPAEVGNISWNLYARIIAPDGTKGNWYLINKHGTPFQNQSDRINGGVTGKPVKLPNFEPGDNFQPAPDDEDIPDEDIQEDDTVNNEPLLTGYVVPPSGGSDPGSGDTYNYYNNYTYNYDNRSWIENHYNNETVSDSDEGLSWIKLFSGFFGIFLLLFGPFLPEWAVTLVTIATPIIIGLAVFKVIKGVIPFI